jgi:hypothetical protein
MRIRERTEAFLVASSSILLTGRRAMTDVPSPRISAVMLYVLYTHIIYSRNPRAFV